MIDIEKIDATTIVTPHGDIDSSRSSHLRGTLKPIVDSNASRIIVDLSDVAYMDSSGIATLIEALQICKQQEKLLYICGLQTTVRSVIELARLDTIFLITDSREDALVA